MIRNHRVGKAYVHTDPPDLRLVGLVDRRILRSTEWLHTMLLIDMGSELPVQMHPFRLDQFDDSFRATMTRHYPHKYTAAILVVTAQRTGWGDASGAHGTFKQPVNKLSTAEFMFCFGAASDATVFNGSVSSTCTPLSSPILSHRWP